ncbi:MAG TPA: hypothetical protein VLX68_17535 [Chitinivibrionales bacterium]|nr:hypothetical protein [Chitinivibrionales bacterium]
MKKLALLSAAVLLISCANTYFCNFTLLDVQRPAGAAEKCGPVAIARDPDTMSIKYRFSDSLFDAVFFITEYQFEFNLKNKTGKPVSILWEKSAYVNPRGERKRVIHRGVSYAQKSVQQQPTVVAKGETVSEIMLPSEHINVYLYGSGGWSLYPLFSQGDVGKNVSVVLAFQIGGVVSEYVFTMKINAI